LRKEIRQKTDEGKGKEEHGRGKCFNVERQEGREK
jgi:hypothetical protein